MLLKGEENKRIVGLDIFRFIAALGIILYHYFFIGVIQGFYDWKVFIPVGFFGEFGVDIFFLISGFVILMSTDRKPGVKRFIFGRIKRIYPTFLVCSIFVLGTGMLMPGTVAGTLVKNWLNSITFYSDLWGGSPLSSIYWTLMVEVKFYVLVAIVMKTHLWNKYKLVILNTWIIFALINFYWLNNNILQMILVTKYSGHFVIGIILYLYVRGEKNRFFIPTAVLASWLVFVNMIGYTGWIRGLYDKLPYSDIEIFIFMVLIIALLYVSVLSNGTGKITKVASTLGAWSFPLFLVHADFGFFIRTQYYRLASVTGPFLNEYMIMGIAVGASLILSFIILKVVNIMSKSFKK